MSLQKICFEYFRARLIPLAVLMAYAFFSAGSAFAIVYVDGDRPGGNGTSWDTAYNTLEAAIAGSGNNQEFWIAEGTYSPGITLEPAAGSVFYGGFAGNEASRNARNIYAHSTVIDGNSILTHVFYLRLPGIRFDGLTIQNGNAAGAGNDGTGGGVFINRVAAIFENCIFQNNVAGSGGAIYGYESDVIIKGCRFDFNLADHGDGRGGAIWLHKESPEIINCSFSSNSANIMGGAIELNNTPGALIHTSVFLNNSVVTVGAGGGGAVSLQWDGVSPEPSASVEGCRFQMNSSGLEGGAIYSNRVHVTVRQSEFIGNSAANGGGLMLDYKLSGAADRVERCTFLGNNASVIGGAIRSYARSVEIKQSVFAYNSTDGSAGAVGFHSGLGSDKDTNYNVKITNSTFYGNEANDWGGGIQNTEVSMLYLYNCIFWNNKGGQKYWDPTAGTYRASNDVSNNGSSSMTTYFTDMESLTWEHGSVSESHTGSFSLNPLFVDPDGADNIAGNQDDNFQLQATSPCIDRANGDFAPECDMDCYPRVDQSTVPNQGGGNPIYADIGALENIEGLSVTQCSSCLVTSPSMPVPPVPPPSGSVTIPPFLQLLLGK